MARYSKLYTNINEKDSEFEMGNKMKETRSCQRTFVLLAFFGIALGLSMRANLSVTIVAIVKQPIPSNDPVELKNDEFSCPYEDTINRTTDFIEGELDMSRTERGFALAICTLGLFSSNLFGGFAAGKFGGKPVTGLGVFLGSILTIATPLAIRYSVPLFIFVRFLIGVAEGIIIPGTFQMIGSWALPKERSRLISSVCSGVYFGVVTTWSLCGILSKSLFLGGWPSLFYLTGGLGIIWTIFWFSLIHETPEVHPGISHWERQRLLSISKIKSDSPKNIPFWSIFTSIPVLGVVLAHCGKKYVLYLVLNELPTFLSEIQHTEISKNGFLSCLAFVACWINTSLFSRLMTKLTLNNTLSILSVRRISMALAGYVPATLLIAMCFVGCNTTLVVAIFILIQGIGGCQYSGLKNSFVDLAPRYAGIVTGISSSFANLSAFSSTIIMEHLVDNNPLKTGWHYGFLIAASLSAITTTIYLTTVDVEVQPWNYEITDDKVEEEADGLLDTEDLATVNAEVHPWNYETTDHGAEDIFELVTDSEGGKGDDAAYK